MGKRRRLVTSDLIIVSFGIRTNKLSKVRSFTERRSTESTSPVVPFTRMMSPTAKGRSPSRKRPLITFEADVCEANPTATVRMPAAPSSTLRSNPSSMRAEAVNSPAMP